MKPIRNDADRDRALAEIEQYFDSPPHPARRRADRFDVLTDLIGDAYESKHYPIDAPDPVGDDPRTTLAMRGFKQADLGNAHRGKSRAIRVDEPETSPDIVNDPEDQPRLENPG